MGILENLAAQLKGHGITSLTAIKQNDATELAEHYLKDVTGGAKAGADDSSINFWLHNQDGSGTFAKDG